METFVAAIGFLTEVALAVLGAVSGRATFVMERLPMSSTWLSLHVRSSHLPVFMKLTQMNRPNIVKFAFWKVKYYILFKALYIMSCKENPMQLIY